MNKLSLKELSIPLINSIDSFNYLLKSHHRRTAVISYFLGRQLKLSDDEMINLVIAAAMHDIGALSIQERDMLIKEDVDFPEPHCIMGYKMLSTFDVFSVIAQIIRHHHIKFEDIKKHKQGEILYQSQIIHLADRVDVLTLTDKFILNQKKAITDTIIEHSGTTFNPEIVEAFKKVSKGDIFWININNMTIEQLFNKINFTLDYNLSIDDVVEFSKTISKIIDYRSKYTASHSATVAHLASSIGEMMGLSEDICKQLEVAGYLHDIGKIGIDPGIIEKKGKLSDEEYSQIKLHAYYTDQILQDLSGNDWFKNIIYWSKNHHENKLGTGYPFSIEGKEVDDGIMILSYADIMSALMENRPYRKPLSIDETFEILEKEVAPKLSQQIYEVLKLNKDKLHQIVLDCQERNNKHFGEIVF